MWFKKWLGVAKCWSLLHYFYTASLHLLEYCSSYNRKDCKEDHVEDCIINVIRNCYEVGLFGEVQPYEGSALQYLMRLKTDFPDNSIQIADAYSN